MEYDEKAKGKFLNEKSRDLLIEVNDSLKALDVFSANAIEGIFKTITETRNIKMGNLAQPVRVAVTGKAESPGIFEVLEIIGSEKTVKRIEKAIRIAEGSL
jgi:glutamyl-tRNA synthetase